MGSRKIKKKRGKTKMKVLKNVTNGSRVMKGVKGFQKKAVVDKNSLVSISLFFFSFLIFVVCLRMLMSEVFPS